MKRLIDDPAIARELRAELQRYAAKQAQVDLQRVYTTLQTGLQVDAAAPPAPLSAVKWSGLSSVSKLLVAAAIGGSVALGVNVYRDSERGPQPTLARSGQAPTLAQPTLDLPSQAPVLTQPSAAAESAAHAPAARAASGAHEPATTEPGIAASGAAAGAGGWRQAQPIAAETATASSTRARSAASGSRREIAQLARIKAVLEQDPAAARRLIRAAQREFPAGLLVEEREGLDVIALFALGQQQRARVNAERFIARYPQSALRPKLERLIADARE